MLTEWIMTELRDSWADAGTSPVRLGLERAVFPRGASLLSSQGSGGRGLAQNRCSGNHDTAFTEPWLSGLKNGDSSPTLQGSVDPLENLGEVPSQLSATDRCLVNRCYQC